MIEHLTSESFERNVDRALADETLRGALRQATGLFSERRRAALAEVEDWEALRTRARAIKDEVLRDLDTHLDRFEERARAHGATVHRARDGAEARRIILDLVRAAGADMLVKSKSMTSEEIGLNDALEAQGIEPIETDLGEWIVQLAGELPSHIIVPAIHKTKRQIAELFRDKVNAKGDETPEELTAIARKILRRKFAEARVGITGVNFAIAETGTILILENEGNIRFTNTLPPVHIALMGIEKVLPRMADLATFLRLLPRSGTGQHLTSYQSLITGPGGREGGEGPREMHIVILDNGRRELLREEITRQSLACIRCGACLNACPVYQQIGGHAYGSVYPGPIGAILTPQLAGLEKTRKLPYASSLCGACRDVCPLKIDIPALLLHLRSKVVTGQDVPGAGGAPGTIRAGRFLERRAFRTWAFFMSGRRRYALASIGARLVARLGGGKGVLARIVGRLPVLRSWTRGRTLHAPGGPSFRDQWRRRGGKGA